LPVPKASGEAHHAVAHVAVQSEVGRQSYKARLLFKLSQLKKRLAHLDAERFSFVASRDGTTVIVSE